jgi:NitT/TauT family transport system ATP-binding protein
MFISVKNVTKTYNHNGQNIDAVRNVTLDIKKSEFVCLLGPSGCGKSTLINMIAGFEQPTEGTVLISGEPVLRPSPRYVTIFQNYGLLPWRTVEKNIQLGLEARKMGRKAMKQVVDEYIEMVGLTGFAKYHPHQLSGGMQQRVAIARTLAVDPEVIFMDEPFGSLDALTRMKMQEVIAGLWEMQNKTIIFITHDLEEAVYLADRIVVMTPNPGEVKTVISLPLSRKRDRTSPDFVKFREEVFNQFETKRDENVEYYL